MESKKMSVTQKMIAAEAGVGQSWVSWALRGDPRAKELSGETRDRILRIARERGYVADASASIMRSGAKSKTVALLCEDSSGEGKFFFRTIREINKNGFGAKVYNIGNIEKAFDDIRASRIPYIINYGVLEEQLVESARLAEKYSLKMAFNVPFVRFRNFPSFDSDNRGIIDDMVSYLVSLGHRRIALHCGPHLRTSSLLRHESFLEALVKRGLRELKHPCLCDEYSDAAFARFLLAERPTALCTVSPGLAIHAMVFLGSIGCRIPEEFSIIAFGDEFLKYCTLPAISSMEEDDPTIRTQAIFRYFLDRGHEGLPSDYSRFFPGTLHARGTTGPPRSDSKLAEKLEAASGEILQEMPVPFNKPEGGWRK